MRQWASGGRPGDAAALTGLGTGELAGKEQERTSVGCQCVSSQGDP